MSQHKNTNKFHIGIIMDGGRRWAKQHNKSIKETYEIGAKVAEKICKQAVESDVISHLTLWVLSSDNQKKRPKYQIAYIFTLLNKVLKQIKNNEISKYIELKIVGDKNNLPESIIENIRNIQTPKQKKVIVYIAINYGGKEEIIYALNNYVKQNTDIVLTKDNFSNFLYEPCMPDLDLIIRTGKRTRVSGFLLWKSEYAEIHFVNKLWPEFNEKDFDKAIQSLQKSHRTFGG